MKNFIVIAILAPLTFSCAHEMTKEEKENKFKEIGQTFMTKKIESWGKKNDGIEAIQLLKIDSIRDLNAQNVYQIDINIKFAEYNRQIEYANKLLDVEKRYDVGTSKSTLYEFEKADKMIDELTEMQSLKTKKSKKKIGDLVYFSAKLVNKDASTQKLPIPIAFNEDFTVSAEVMDKTWK